MTSPQHARWIRSGMQWQLAHPLVALRDRLRGYGYTVYDIGNTSHLDHIPPEDHTPYSETGWPGTTPYGWVTAIDIMPPGGGLPSLQQLGAQMVADRQAGVPGVAWLKYINWGPVNNSHAVQDRWTPGHKTISSSDTGHIHASGRSDHVLSATQAELDYDPVARLRGQSLEAVEEDMPFVAKDGNTGQYYVCDMITSRPVPAAAVTDVLYLARQLNYGHGPEGVEWTDGGWTRLGWSEAVFGALVKPAGDVTVEVTGGQLDEALTRVEIGRAHV